MEQDLDELWFASLSLSSRISRFASAISSIITSIAFSFNRRSLSAKEILSFTLTASARMPLFSADSLESICAISSGNSENNMRLPRDRDDTNLKKIRRIPDKTFTAHSTWSVRVFTEFTRDQDIRSSPRHGDRRLGKYVKFITRSGNHMLLQKPHRQLGQTSIDGTKLSEENWMTVLHSKTDV